MGPARVVFCEPESQAHRRRNGVPAPPGAIIWVVHQGKLLRRSPQQLRDASPRERFLAEMEKPLVMPTTAREILEQTAAGEYEDISQEIPRWEELEEATYDLPPAPPAPEAEDDRLSEASSASTASQGPERKKPKTGAAASSSGPGLPVVETAAEEDEPEVIELDEETAVQDGDETGDTAGAAGETVRRRIRGKQPERRRSRSPRKDGDSAEHEDLWTERTARPQAAWDSYDGDVVIMEIDVERPVEFARDPRLYVTQKLRQGSAEVSWRGLSADEKKEFREAMDKEINEFIISGAVEPAVRKHIPAERMLRMRWVLTWKAVPPEDGVGPSRKAKARLLHTSDAADDLTRILLGGCVVCQQQTNTELVCVLSSIAVVMYF